MKKSSLILGIDVGSVSIHLALVAPDKTLVFQTSCYHHGEVKAALARLVEQNELTGVTHVAKTAASPSFIQSDFIVDDQVAIIRSVRHLHHGKAGAVLNIGGENFSLSLFDEMGNYTGARHNTSCAAGTGSFLYQQAGRLHLSGSKEISSMALKNTKKRPDIATRCAVFAKTDLIHSQQEGYDLNQICDGLCYGLAKNIANTLFKQKKVQGSIVFCGGVSLNAAVSRHLEQIVGIKLETDSNSLAYGALGAALSLMDGMARISPNSYSCPDDYFKIQENESVYRYPALCLTLSDYPDFTCFNSYDHEKVEVDIYKDPDRGSSVSGFLGLDVGSTSTKAIIVDIKGDPLAGFYTKTASRPVQAVQQLFKACDHFITIYSLDLSINGCGTTGSGRRISAKIIGADIEPDEITAHACAAVNLNPKVDTIIEIGGQDAKFTLLRDGMVTSSVMQYGVCRRHRQFC